MFLNHEFITFHSLCIFYNVHNPYKYQAIEYHFYKFINLIKLNSKSNQIYKEALSCMMIIILALSIKFIMAIKYY